MIEEEVKQEELDFSESMESAVDLDTNINDNRAMSMLMKNAYKQEPAVNE